MGSNPSQFQFVPRVISGTMSNDLGQLGANGTGAHGSGLYYDIVLQTGSIGNYGGVTNISANLNNYQSPGGAGTRVGVIAYDYVQKVWGVFFTTSDINLIPPGVAGDAISPDITAILNFVATLAPLPATNPVEFGDAYPAGASIPSLD